MHGPLSFRYPIQVVKVFDNQEMIVSPSLLSANFGNLQADGITIDPIGDGIGEVLGATRQLRQDDVIDEEDGDFAVFEIELVRLDRNLVVAVGNRSRPRAFEEIDVFGEIELFCR